MTTVTESQSAGGRGAVLQAGAAVHLLAQLPPSTDLCLPAVTADVRRLAAAYGLGDRVHEGSAQAMTFHDGTDTWEPAGVTSRGFAKLCDEIGDCRPSAATGAPDDVLSGERALFVTNHPAHYRHALFSGLARRLAAVGGSLTVVFLAEGEKSRPWLTDPDIRFPHRFVGSIPVPIRQRAPLLPLRLESTIRDLEPTIVVAAGFSPLVAARAIRAGRKLGAVTGIWSGETHATAYGISSARLRTRVALARQVDFAIAYGISAAEYLTSLRRELPIVLGRNTAPVAHEVVTPEDDGVRRIVYVGDLASIRKGADVALNAFGRVDDPCLRLLLIGGGHLAAELAHRARADNRVRFLGGVPPSETRRHLSGAHAFLFPTRSDVFGLALVEAMGSGATPIVSTAAGAAADLIVDGRSGVLVDGLEPDRWARAIVACIADPRYAAELGERARSTVLARWTIDHAVDAMLAGLKLGVLSRRTGAVS
jgi:glycosyltransferase involved in cell wall biosynthesis